MMTRVLLVSVVNVTVSCVVVFRRDARGRGLGARDGTYESYQIRSVISFAHACMLAVHELEAESDNQHTQSVTYTNDIPETLNKGTSAPAIQDV